MKALIEQYQSAYYQSGAPAIRTQG